MYIAYRKRSQFVESATSEDSKENFSALIHTAIEKSEFLPSGIVLGSVNERHLLQNIVQSSFVPNMRRVNLHHFSGAGVQGLLYGMQYLNFDIDSKAFLCTAYSSNEDHYLKANKNNGTDNFMFENSNQTGVSGFDYDSIDDWANKLAIRDNITLQDQNDYIAIAKQKYIKNKLTIKKDFLHYSIEDQLRDCVESSNLENSQNECVNSICKASFKSTGSAAIMLKKFKQKNTDAKILGIAEYAGPVSAFLQSPIFATSKLLNKLKLKKDDIKIFEVSESFVAMPIIFMRAFNLNHDKVNILGSSCVIGNVACVSNLHTVMNAILSLEKVGGGIAIAAISIDDGHSIALALSLE
jgi:hypothetical protein